MIDAFEKLFGTDPFDVYGAAVVNDDIGGALETQTLSVFGRDSPAGAGNGEFLTLEDIREVFGDYAACPRASAILGSLTRPAHLGA